MTPSNDKMTPAPPVVAQPQANAQTASPITSLQAQFITMVENFDDKSQEWRRLFSELLGTFFLVLVAAGGGMMGQAFPDTISAWPS